MWKLECEVEWKVKWNVVKGSVENGEWSAESKMWRVNKKSGEESGPENEV